MPSSIISMFTNNKSNAFSQRGGISISTMATLLLLLLNYAFVVQASPGFTYKAGLETRKGMTLGLVKRADNCPSGTGACPQANLAKFCCPFGNVCTPLADGKAVSCCAPDQDCRLVAALDCASSDVLGGQRCTQGKSAGKCCPPSFLCSPTYCQMDAELWPPRFLGSQNANKNETAMIVPVSTTTIKQRPAFPAQAILVGMLPGLLVGALLMYLAACLWDRRKSSRVNSFKKMPETRLVSGTQNLHPSQMRMASGMSHNQKNSSLSTDLVIGFNPNDVDRAATNGASGAMMHGALQPSSADNSSSNGGKKGTGPMGYQSSAPSIRAPTYHTNADDEEVARRGRLRVHGETPQLPSLHISSSILSPTFPSSQQPIAGFGPMPMVTSPETYNQQQQQQQQPTKASGTTRQGKRGHRRNNSNPSYNDITETRYQYKDPSRLERVRSFGSDTSVSSSVHSSASEKSIGQRYPIKIPGTQQRNITQSSVALPASTQATPQIGIKISPPKQSEAPQAGLLKVTTTTSSSASSSPPNRDYRNTTFELDDDMTPITPMSPLDNKPVPPPAPEPPIAMPFYSQNGDSTVSLDAQNKRMSTISYATTAADRQFQYQSFIPDTDSESIYGARAESMYPQSFYEVHFEASPTSPEGGAVTTPTSGPGNLTPGIAPGGKGRQMTLKLENVPAVPIIPALFAGNKGAPRKSVLANVVNADDLSDTNSIPEVPYLPKDNNSNGGVKNEKSRTLSYDEGDDSPFSKPGSMNNRNNTDSVISHKSGFDAMVGRNKSLRRGSESSDRSAEVPFAIDNAPPTMMSPYFPPKSPGAWSFVTNTTNMTVPTLSPKVVNIPPPPPPPVVNVQPAPPTMVAPPPPKPRMPPNAGKGLGSLTMNGGRYTMQTHEMLKST